MGMVYATADHGKRVLVQLECDNRCGRNIRPGPHIMKSGWHKAGFYGLGQVQPTFYYCPECWKVVGPEWKYMALEAKEE